LLAKRHGTPLYVYSGDQIVERLGLFQQALEGREHLVCYAVKANSALGILKLLADRGAGFDIVSGGELRRVLAAAPEAAGRVVFSGAGKTAAEIDLALDAGILEFNVESEAELTLLAQRAAKLRKKARFALRVNPDVFAETHPYISTGLCEHKFGVDIRQALGIYKSMAGNRWLEACGVSVHIGSQIRSAEPFGAAITRVSKLVRQLRREGIALQSIDAGGGLGIDYHTGKFDAAAKVQEYAAALEKGLGDFTGRLMIEPGRFIVAHSGALVARVLYVKRNGKKTFVITDAAMNDLIRLTMRLCRSCPGQGSRRSWMWWGRSANRETFLPTTASCHRLRRATWWRFSMPAPTAWRKAPTTTPACDPPKYSSRAPGPVSSAAAKPSPIFSHQRFSEINGLFAKESTNPSFPARCSFVLLCAAD
jgi:diaminopimelate decarboxylase